MVAIPAAVSATHQIIGDAGPYLLFWVLAIPVLVAIGWAHLLAAGRAQERGTAPALIWAGLAVATVVAAGAVLVGVVDTRAAPPPADSAIGRGAPLLAQRLDAFGHQPVLITIANGGRWPVATGLALELSRRGWPAYVAGDHAAMFDLGPPPGLRPRMQMVVTGTSTSARGRPTPGGGVRDPVRLTSSWGSTCARSAVDRCPASVPGAQVVAHDVLAEPFRRRGEDPATVAAGHLLDELDQPGLVVEHEDVDRGAGAGSAGRPRPASAPASPAAAAR